MPRRPRVMLPGVPVHLIQRGNNRQVCFAAPEDYRNYLDWLIELSPKTGCHVHAYVLMTNHVHLLLTCDETDSAAKLMKALGQRYVQYFNKAYKRSGTLWEGRYRSCLLQEEEYLMACMRYIELNPVRAGMVDHPGDYRWSSYRTNAQGEKHEGLKPHALYKSLGLDEAARQKAYRELFRYELYPGIVDEIRGATNGNVVLGNGRFSTEVEKMLGRRVTRGQSGRPRRSVDEETGMLF